VFETVTVWAGLAIFSPWGEKESWVGLTLRPGPDCPLPLRATVTGFVPVVDDEMVSVADAPPFDPGVKITCTVQLAPTSRLAPQFVAPVEKSAAAGPVIWKPTLLIAAPPLFVTFRVAGELATPTACEGNTRLVGLTENTGGIRPDPLSVTVCPGFTASAIVSEPVCVPDWMGVKETPSEQLEWATSCAVQSFFN
jgi:hypothetical protein